MSEIGQQKKNVFSGKHVHFVVFFVRSSSTSNLNPIFFSQNKNNPLISKTALWIMAAQESAEAFLDAENEPLVAMEHIASRISHGKPLSYRAMGLLYDLKVKPERIYAIFRDEFQRKDLKPEQAARMIIRWSSKDNKTKRMFRTFKNGGGRHPPYGRDIDIKIFQRCMEEAETGEAMNWEKMQLIALQVLVDEGPEIHKRFVKDDNPTLGRPYKYDSGWAQRGCRRFGINPMMASERDPGFVMTPRMWTWRYPPLETILTSEAQEKFNFLIDEVRTCVWLLA